MVGHCQKSNKFKQCIQMIHFKKVGKTKERKGTRFRVSWFSTFCRCVRTMRSTTPTTGCPVGPGNAVPTLILSTSLWPRSVAFAVTGRSKEGRQRPDRINLKERNWKSLSKWPHYFWLPHAAFQICIGQLVRTQDCIIHCLWNGVYIRIFTG